MVKVVKRTVAKSNSKSEGKVRQPDDARNPDDLAGQDQPPQPVGPEQQPEEAETQPGLLEAGTGKEVEPPLDQTTPGLKQTDMPQHDPKKPAEPTVKVEVKQEHHESDTDKVCRVLLKMGYSMVEIEAALEGVDINNGKFDLNTVVETILANRAHLAAPETSDLPTDDSSQSGDHGQNHGWAEEGHGDTWWNWDWKSWNVWNWQWNADDTEWNRSWSTPSMNDEEVLGTPTSRQIQAALGRSDTLDSQEVEGAPITEEMVDKKDNKMDKDICF